MFTLNAHHSNGQVRHLSQKTPRFQPNVQMPAPILNLAVNVGIPLPQLQSLLVCAALQIVL